jgi:hypothetical protein
MTSGDLNDALVGQIDRQPWQRPARQRHPLLIGTGTGHGDDLLALISRDPAGTPAPVARAQAVHPALVEVMDDLAHPRRIGLPHLRDLRRCHLHVGRQQHRSTLTRALMLSSLGQPLEPGGLVVQQRPDEHLRRTHHHLQGRDASPFAADERFPVQRSIKGH